MSASRLPAAIEHPGRRSVEIEPGCKLIWWRNGNRWSLRSEQLLDFVVDRLHNQIRWPVQ